MLAKSRDDRYATMSDVVQALEAVLNDAPVRENGAPATTPAGKSATRGRAEQTISTISDRDATMAFSPAAAADEVAIRTTDKRSDRGVSRGAIAAAVVGLVAIVGLAVAVALGLLG
jgi:hypothetical protein